MPTGLPFSEASQVLAAMEREIAITSQYVFSSRRAIAQSEALIERVDQLMDKVVIGDFSNLR